MDANVKNDEFAKLTTRERIAYGGGDFAQNLVFGTVGGFLLTGADVKIMDRFFRYREVPDSENFSKPGFQLKTA